MPTSGNAPDARMAAMVIRPIGPQPITTTDSPVTLPSSTQGRSATPSGSSSEASSNESASGMCCAADWGTMQYSAKHPFIVWPIRPMFLQMCGWPLALEVLPAGHVRVRGDSVAGLEIRHVRPHRVNHTRELVAEDAREGLEDLLRQASHA